MQCESNSPRIDISSFLFLYIVYLRKIHKAVVHTSEEALSPYHAVLFTLEIPLATWPDYLIALAIFLNQQQMIRPNPKSAPVFCHKNSLAIVIQLNTCFRTVTQVPFLHLQT